MTATLADAETQIRNGDPEAALQALSAAVRADPANARLRVFLFQLLCVLGDWKRALAQLKLCGEMDAAALPMAYAYREAILCEAFREDVFAGTRQPLISGAPADWVAWLLRAGEARGAGRPDEAAALRERAFAEAPAVAGTLNGTPFSWIADADSRLGPVFELILTGSYYWVPVTAIRRLTAEPPADLRDFVWMPCIVTFAAGGETPALMPARYPGTATHGSKAQKLSRATDWTDLGGNSYAGLGQRILTTDTAEFPLLELRELVLEAPADG